MPIKVRKDQRFILCCRPLITTSCNFWIFRCITMLKKEGVMASLEDHIFDYPPYINANINEILADGISNHSRCDLCGSGQTWQSYFSLCVSFFFPWFLAHLVVKLSSSYYLLFAKTQGKGSYKTNILANCDEDCHDINSVYIQTMKNAEAPVSQLLLHL